MWVLAGVNPAGPTSPALPGFEDLEAGIMGEGFSAPLDPG
jgi:hypothetical protein